MFAFQKKKIEDEMVSKIRLESLVWIPVNYLILLLCVIFYLWIFFSSCNEVQYVTLLLFFIIRSLDAL
jgi:hypothetical protein